MWRILAIYHHYFLHLWRLLKQKVEQNKRDEVNLNYLYCNNHKIKILLFLLHFVCCFTILSTWKQSLAYWMPYMNLTHQNVNVAETKMVPQKIIPWTSSLCIYQIFMTSFHISVFSLPTTDSNVHFRFHYKLKVHPR